MADKASTRNKVLRTSQRVGRTIWRRWRGHHRRSRAETKMQCVQLPGQRLSARDFDRQVAEVQVRVAVPNGFTTLGTPVPQVAGEVSSGKGEPCRSLDLCNRAPLRIPARASGTATAPPCRRLSGSSETDL
jgi:hypothetical protein